MRFNIQRWISVFLIGRLLLFLPQGPATGLSMLSPQSSVQIDSEQKNGVPYGEYIQSRASEFRGQNLDVLRIYVVGKVIQSYLNLLTRLGKGALVPDLPTLDNVRVVTTQKTTSLGEDEELEIIFTEGVSFEPLPAAFQERAERITRFVQQLQALALKEKVNPEYFISILLDKATPPEKTDILVSLIATLDRIPAVQIQKLDQELQQQAFKELMDVLEDLVKDLKRIRSDLSNEGVENELKNLRGVLGKIPRTLNIILERKIVLLMTELFDAPHPFIQKASRQIVAQRYNFGTVLSPEDLFPPAIATSI